MEQDRNKWRELVANVGEKAAKNHVANKLRELAKTVESDGYPMVFDWSEEDFGDPLPIATFSLTLSFPWPG